MQVSLESVQGLEKRMTVEVPAEQVEQAVEQRIQRIARSVRLDGFRPGKAPLRVVRQRFGDQARREAYGELIETSFQQAATQEKLRVVAQPRIELKDVEGGALGYVATFEVMPELTLSDLSGAVIRRPTASVQESDVDVMIESLRRQRTTWVEVERAAQEGDTVQISFKGTVDGEAFPGGSADHVPLTLGSGSMIPGFESGLVGMSKGEVRTLDLSFPADYRVANLAGKPASFEVTVHRVNEPRLPDLDEAFVRSFGVADGTADSLRADVRANMERELEQRLEAALKERVMNLLMERNPVDVPAALVADEAKRLRDQARGDLTRAGHSSALELPLSLFEEQARRRVWLGLLVGEVIRSQGLKVDGERVRRKIERLAESYEQPDDVVSWYYANHDALRPVENLVLEDQVADWVVSRLQVEDEPTTFAAITAH
jgi:trigger factor